VSDRIVAWKEAHSVTVGRGGKEIKGGHGQIIRNDCNQFCQHPGRVDMDIQKYSFESRRGQVTQGERKYAGQPK